MTRKILLAGLVLILIAGFAYVMASKCKIETASISGESNPSTSEKIAAVNTKSVELAQNDRPASDATAEEPLIKDYKEDFMKLAWPPAAPKNKKELKDLADRIVRLGFPECAAFLRNPNAVKSDKEVAESFYNCQQRLYYESTKISQVRDRELVPELISIALKTKYQESPLTPNALQEAQVYYHMQICMMRFNSISALGEIGDPRAIDPLLELVDEMQTDKNDPLSFCRQIVPSRGDEYISFTCLESAKALKKFGKEITDRDLLPSLLAQVDNYPPKNASDEDAYNASISMVCHLMLAPQFGATALDEVLKKYQDPSLSPEAKQALLGVIKLTDDPALVPRLKNLMHSSEDKGIAESAAEALSDMASPDLTEEYIWMADNGYFEQACDAMKKLKDPAMVPYLVKILENNDYLIASKAAYVLKEYGPLAKNAVPALNKKLESCDEDHNYCGDYAKALGSIGDERALPFLFEFAITHPGGYGSESIKAIGNIKSKASIDLLKEILNNEGRGEKIPENKTYDVYSQLRLAAVDGLLKLEGQQALPFLCKFRDDPELRDHLTNHCKGRD